MQTSLQCCEPTLWIFVTRSHVPAYNQLACKRINSSEYTVLYGHVSPVETTAAGTTKRGTLGLV